MENKWKIIIGILSIGLIVVGAISWIAYEKSSRDPPIQDTSYLIEKIEENAREIEKVKLLRDNWTERDEKIIDELFSILKRGYHTYGRIISYDSNGTNIYVKFTFEGGGMILHSDEKTTDMELYWGWEDKEEIALLIENLEDQSDVVRDAIRDKLEDYGFVSLTIAEPLPESIQYIRGIPQSYLTFNKETIRQIFNEEKSAYWSEDIGAWIVVIRGVPIIDTTRETLIEDATLTLPIIWVEEDDSEGIPHPEKTVLLTHPNTTAINYIEFWAKGDTFLEAVAYNGEYQVVYLSDSCEYYYMLHYRYCGIYPEDLKLYSTDRSIKFEVYIYRILEVREYEARVWLEKSFIIPSEIIEDC